MTKLKKYFLNIKSRKIKKISQIILNEKYNEFEKYIDLFYDNKRVYKEEIFKNKEVFGTDPETEDIYAAVKRFAVYNKAGVLYYRADIFDKNASWNRTAEMFDFLFQEIFSQEIMFEILRKCFFTDKEYSSELFFSYIQEVLENNNLKMYFWDDCSDILLFFILKKDRKIIHGNFRDFLSNNKKYCKKAVYSIGI
jgi:hypothetical protein